MCLACVWWLEDNFWELVLLLPCAYQGLNLGLQAWWQVFLPGEPTCLALPVFVSEWTLQGLPGLRCLLFSGLPPKSVVCSVDEDWGSSGNRRLWGKLTIHSEKLTSCFLSSRQEGEADHSGYGGEVGFRVSTRQCVSASWYQELFSLMLCEH